MQNANRVFNGAIFTVAMRWSDRLIGLISTVVLARLLVPEDFGIVAMAMLVVGFIDVFLNLGVNQVLIHNSDAQKEDYDTAWTVRFLQACCLGGIVFISAPLAVDYFETPDVANVLRVMCISIVIGGLENIGIITFQKEMKFNLDFKFFIVKRVVSFLVTMAIALSFQTYWAMVIGSMLGRFTGVILSYTLHPFRPQFSLSRLNAIWSFSQWVLFKNIGGYLDGTLDRFLIGNRIDANALGGYTISGEIAALPTTELLAPMGRVLFPAFVEKRGDKKSFSSRVALAIGTQALIALPACVGLMFVAQDLVYVALGEKWAFVAPLLQVMAISNLVVALGHSCGYALLALGMVKLQACIAWLQAFIFLGVVLLFGTNAAARDFAVMRLFVISVGTVILISVVVFHARVLTINAFLSALLRPLLGVAMMLLVLKLSSTVFVELTSHVRLLLQVSIGIICYFIAITLMWMMAGRPEGAEAYFLTNIKHRPY